MEGKLRFDPVRFLPQEAPVSPRWRQALPQRDQAVARTYCSVQEVAQ